jgi:non-specific serine/threonine protein kinase
MPLISLAPILTPHGRLTLEAGADAPAVDAALAQRLRDAFARGSGHGLLQLGANEIGVALPADLSFWRATESVGRARFAAGQLGG